ncbi:aromatic prenyltransferase [Mycena sp. CBHHK59/15]|nr:aromatic prenyltransferase [Mycena sp. CBHHK59/15]
MDGQTRRFQFWRKEIDRLEHLLALSGYPERLRSEYLSFFASSLVPLFGPSPSEFLNFKPSSFLSDDHTPFELGWAIDKQGDMSVQFDMEPLSPLDGSSPPPTLAIASVHIFEGMEGFDLTWSNICRDTLVSNHAPGSQLQHSSQFILGGDLTDHGIVGKVYFLPHVRAAIDHVSVDALVNVCMSELGLADSWDTVASYIKTLPESSRPILETVAVDCLKPTKNRAKAYFRTQATCSSFNDIAQLMTLGGRISDERVSQTLSAMRHLWSLFFPGVPDDAPLSSIRPVDYYPTGFLIYYQMSLRHPIPVPKIYIPVRHYCADDSYIATALSQYFKDINLDTIGDSYTATLKNIFTHRNLSDRTGIQVYVGLCTKQSSAGPVLYIYLSPEVFAPERAGDKKETSRL